MSELRRKRDEKFSGVDLYPVTGAGFSRGRTTEQIVEAVVAAGCKVVQLREKDLSRRAYFELAERVRRLTQGVLMICNDHLDVALAVGADGVHLGTDDLPLAAARKLAPDMLIGASSHDLDQALAAQQAGADYVNIGPDAIAQIAPKLKVPFTVMGGIKPENLDQVLDAGARRIAVVTAVTAADDPRAAAEEMRRRIVNRRDHGTLASA